MGIGTSHNTYETTFQKLIEIRKLASNRTLYREPETAELYQTSEHTFGTTEQLELFEKELKRRI